MFWSFESEGWVRGGTQNLKPESHNSAGSSVTRVRPGDRVKCDSVVGCGSCEWCRSGASQFCQSGSEFGITRERIRQIEAVALRKLRHPHLGKKLRGYLD